MKKIILQLKIMSALVILLGVVHVGATLVFFPVFKKDAVINYSSLYMFAMVGISVVLTGWLQWYLSGKILENKAMKHIMKMSIFFMILVGLGAVLAMPDNPFAYISLAIAVYETVLVSLLGNSSENMLQ